MTRIFVPLLLAVLAGPMFAPMFAPMAQAQTDEPLDIVTEPEEDEGDLDNSLDENFGDGVGEIVTSIQDGPGVSKGSGAVLVGLDKVSGTSADLNVQNGQTIGLGWLQITLGECRYPTSNPSGDAYAWLVIREHNNEATVFQGWMIASSPALSALDHARYDVWVKNCTTE